MDYEALYDGIMKLQRELRLETELSFDYQEVKALAATYELQEYLAQRIAEQRE